VIEEPDSRSAYAVIGAVEGAWSGWLLGLCLGVGILSLPELGLVFARGSVLAAFLAGIMGGVGGGLIGGFVGSLISRISRQKDTQRLGS
jgi:hypothetical protein